MARTAGVGNKALREVVVQVAVQFAGVAAALARMAGTASTCMDSYTTTNIFDL
jgi:hypothetical protein